MADDNGARRDEHLTDEQRRADPEHGKRGADELAPGRGRDEQSATAGGGILVEKPPPTGARGAGKPMSALTFLAPAIVVLGALILYPTVYTIWRSFFGGGPDPSFVGLENYVSMFTDDTTLTAVKNNFVWVLVAPTFVTALGLVFAVLIDRIRLRTAFKTVIFMPMAISFLAVGIIFRLVYQSDPNVGVANAVITGVQGFLNPTGSYPTAQPSVPDRLERTPEGSFLTTFQVGAGDQALVGLVGIGPEYLPPPEERPPAQQPEQVADDEIAGTVWFDFSPDGERGQLDEGEFALPGIDVAALSNGEVVASDVSGENGVFTLSGLDPGQNYRLRLGPQAFSDIAGGIQWLGAQQWLWVAAATWAIIAAFIWMWAGFAMVIISAGLSSIPREVMESARVDGASEWQVFRRITVPLLMPVILVVVVTLMINVLKIFDLVLIMAPGSVQDDATVLALRMWRVSFGGAGNHGLGSAITVFLFLLVVPAMLFNIRRFRTEE